MSWFVPTAILPTYRDMTPELCRKYGIRGLILDVDNTFAPYEMPDPDDEIRRWVGAMREAGIALAFASNNDPPRLTRFNRDLGCLMFCNAKKPGVRAMRAAMAAMGTDEKTTAVMGDQIFTDVVAGRRLQLCAFLVPPIRDKKNLFFRTKRFLERPFIRRYYRLHPEEENIWKIV